MFTLMGATEIDPEASTAAISFTSTCGALSNFVGGIQAARRHLPCRWPATSDVQVELLFLFRCIHDGKGEVLMIRCEAQRTYGAEWCYPEGSSA